MWPIGIGRLLLDDEVEVPLSGPVLDSRRIDRKTEREIKFVDLSVRRILERERVFLNVEFGILDIDVRDFDVEQ